MEFYLGLSSCSLGEMEYLDSDGKKKEGDKLWVKILKDEYFPNSNLFRVNLKKGSWYMWNCYEQRRRDLGFHVKVTFINYKI